jgi:hypothetical protein
MGTFLMWPGNLFGHHKLVAPDLRRRIQGGNGMQGDMGGVLRYQILYIALQRWSILFIYLFESDVALIPMTVGGLMSWGSFKSQLSFLSFLRLRPDAVHLGQTKQMALTKYA